MQIGCVFILCVVAENVSATPHNTDLQVRQKLFNALKKLACYYQHAFRNINLDAVFGIRIAQGILKKTSNEIRNGILTADQDILFEIEKLHASFSATVKKATPYIKSSTKEYYEKVGFVISQPWTIIKPYRNLDFNLYVPVSKHRAINEIGDPHQECLAALHGNARNGYMACQITDNCWTAMTKKGEVGYTLTHQALFFMLGKVQGCQNLFVARLRHSNISGGFDQIYDQICATMYGQNYLIGHLEHKTRRNIDLFLEQAVLCGLLGYHEFLSSDWLSRILRWQHSNGCFGEMPSNSKDSTSSKQAEVNRGSFYANCRDYGLNRRTTMRSILTEKLLPENCEAHVTGVATSLLALYLRWLIGRTAQEGNLDQGSETHFQRRPPKLHILQISEAKDVESNLEATRFTCLILVILTFFAASVFLIIRHKLQRVFQNPALYLRRRFII